MAEEQFPGNYAEIYQGYSRAGSTRLSFTKIGITSPDGFGIMDQTRINLLCQAAQTAIRTITPAAVTLTGSFLRWNPFAVVDKDLFTAPSTIAPQAGSRAGTNMAPPNVAVLVRKQAGFTGRSGRFFWPLVMEADVDDLGNIVPAQLTTFQTAATLLYTSIDALEANTIANATLSWRKDDVGPSAVPVTAYVVDDVVATQRRRLR